jgi:hypothetical protein
VVDGCTSILPSQRYRSREGVLLTDHPRGSAAVLLLSHTLHKRSRVWESYFKLFISNDGLTRFSEIVSRQTMMASEGIDIDTLTF